MKKIFRKIHLWLSVPFGLIITLICFSGAMLVFENEVMELTRHDLYYVKKVEAAPLPIEQLLEQVAATLPDSILVTGVNISSDPERAYQVNLSKPRRASMYVDPYTGEVKGRYERSPFFMTMFRLHRWLLDSVKQDGSISWGKMIVGVSTLLFVFVLLSGLVIWWPRTKKALKNRLKITVDKGWRRFWYDSHVAAGMYAFLFLLAMAVTGLTWSFSWYRTGFYKVFGVEMQQGGGGHGAAPQTGKEGGRENGRKEGRQRDGKPAFSPYAHWQQVYEQLAERNPGYKQISLSKGSAHVSFNALGNQRASDSYKFNPRTGEITEVTLYKDAGNASKIRGWIFSVHVGSWGGMFTRILTFIAALIGASLPLTGYYLWIKRSWRKKRKSNCSAMERA
ncbi:PepSY-associated TM helix domain-containing protein [Phocaeicola sp.]